MVSGSFSTIQVDKFAGRRSLYLPLSELELEATEVRSQSLPAPYRELSMAPKGGSCVSFPIGPNRVPHD